jgi:hypothetical protein
MPVSAAAEEGGDSFALPEAPPTVERKKMPPLDRPMIQKQDYISDNEIEPPFIVQPKDFYSFGGAAYGGADEAGVSRGAYSSYGAHFGYTSPDGWNIGFKTSRSRGEAPNLFSDMNALSYGWRRPLGEHCYASAELGASDAQLWTQKKSDYYISSAFSWYPLETLNVKLTAAGDSGEIAGMEKNDAFDGSAGISVMPWKGHSFSAVLRRFSDTSDPAAKDYFDSDLLYGIAPADGLLIKAGARMQQDESFPEGGLYWNFLSGARFSAEYRPGTEKPSWRSLYMNGFYVKTAAVAWPRAESFMREAVSYYFRDDLSLKLEYSHGRWRNYICMSRVAGGDYLAPVNAAETDISAGTVEAAFKRGIFLGKLSFTRNTAPGVTMMPESAYEAGLECGLPAGWTVSAGYDYLSEQLTVLNGASKLSDAADLSAAVRKEFNGIQIYAGCRNILGNKLETQPGFISTSPVAETGLTIKFR